MKYMYVAVSVVRDTQIHTHTYRTTTVTLVHAPRVNEIQRRTLATSNIVTP